MKQRVFTNPIYGGYFADPYVWSHNGEYYAIGTGRTEADGAVAASTRATIFPLLRSTNLIDWREAGHALVRPDPALGDTFWAPEVVQASGEWFLYYSVGHEDRMHQLRVATSRHPDGPYIDRGGLTDVDECPFAIDPHPFQDRDGRWYLFHARDFLNEQDEEGRSVRAGTALVVSPLENMMKLSSTRRTLARARYDWQRFAANRPMYGHVFDWHTLEGPFVIEHGGLYYCFYSGGCWQTDTYGVDYVVSRSVMGPYVDEGAQTGPRVLRTKPGVVLGPGHCSIVFDASSAMHVIVYHAWDPGMIARRMCIDPLIFTPQGPRSPGPTWTPQTLPSIRAEV